MIPCHLDRIGITQKIRSVQHVHVQGVTLDPLPAVREPPERAQLPVHLQSEGVFDRMDGAHLIGDRTDAANARSNIRRFFAASPAKKSFKEARWFEDLELHIHHRVAPDLHVEPALAFHTRQVVNANRPCLHGPRFPGGMALPKR